MSVDILPVPAADHKVVGTEKKHKKSKEKKEKRRVGEEATMKGDGSTEEPKKNKEKKNQEDDIVKPKEDLARAQVFEGDVKKSKKRKHAETREEGAVVDAETDGVDGEKKKKKKSKKEKSSKSTEVVPETAVPVKQVGNEDVEMVSTETPPAEPSALVVAPSTSASQPTPILSKAERKAQKLAMKLVKQSSVTPSGTATPLETPIVDKTPTPTQPQSDFSLASCSPTESTNYLTSNSITITPSNVYRPYLQFSKIPINPSLKPYLKSFKNPTPIQASSWPALFNGKDVVGIAETGSGKTLGFGLPGIHQLGTSSPKISPSSSTDGSAQSKKGKTNSKSLIRLLVLAPTRELALQTHQTLSDLGNLVNIDSVCLFGGMSRDEQVRSLGKKSVGIVVGTPGRVLDLVDSGEVDFSRVEYLVLDEADRMLDQGFENDIRRIIAYCPSKEQGRQTVMFSATWPESVRRLAGTFLSDPVRITVGSEDLTANKRIEQIVEVLDNSREKDPRLSHYLSSHFRSHPSSSPIPCRILVFALYKKEATRLEQTIRRYGYKVAGLHGDLGQDARLKALDAFKEVKVNVLVATDVAARGLDIPDVGLVINVTFPLTTEDYVHRIGRTGRAGKSGKAVTFFTGENHERSLAGEFMQVLRDAGVELPSGMSRFPSTIKKKEHSVYGAFYRDTSDAKAATKIKFD